MKTVVSNDEMREIVNEYLSGTISRRALSEKYDIPEDIITTGIKAYLYGSTRNYRMLMTTK